MSSLFDFENIYGIIFFGDKMRNKGFTLIEVIVIISIIGILSTVAVSRFVNFRNEANLAVEKQNVGSVRVGINYYYIESAVKGRTPLYPPVLDLASSTFSSSQNPLFTYVLAIPVTQGWRKLSSTLYQGYSGSIYFYDPNTGNFGGRTVLTDQLLNLLGFSSADITADLINRMNTQNVVTFSNGKKLVGGSAVLTPRSGAEPTLSGTDTLADKFSYFRGNLGAEITGEYAGYADRIRIGYYTVDPDTGTKTLHQVFSGPDSTGVTNSFSVNAGEIVGFYFTSPEGSGYTYYSEKNSNPDKFDHMRVYQNETLKKITIGCEDLYNGGDQDFQDFIVTISY